jgi:uncharacterized protein (DUF1810 family)
MLGPRLLECTALMTSVDGKAIRDIVGSPDDLKFRSSMTLFAHAAADNKPFEDALKKYFSGEYDALTLERLR